MRKSFSTTILATLALALAGCGGGGDDPFQTPGTGGGGQSVSAVTVTSSSPTILSDNSTSATITATVRDANNNAVPDAVVTFSSDSGLVAVTQGTTDASGVATATLSTPGDSTLRTIQVTATASGVSGNTNVSVVAPPAPPVPAQISVLTSTPTIPSNGSLTTEITAIVRNANNQFLPGVQVTFTATSGGLTVTQGTTDASGVAKATLSAAGDPTNRTITVTAEAGATSSTIDVSVTGTRLSIQGAAALALGQSSTYTVSLVNSADVGIGGRAVTVSSANGNTLSATNLVTDSNGRATFNLTIANAGDDTLTATGLGLTTTLDIAINDDAFTFTAPAADNAEVLLGAVQTLTVRWTSAGAPVVGQTINFAATRGTLSASSAITNGSGDATVTVSSTSAGGSSVTATGTGVTAQRFLEFVATTPTTVEAQPSLFTVAPNEQSTITATVRDATGNLVKNQTVLFTLQQDSTGGVLSTASAITNSQGRAQTVYTAGSTTSANNGVQIRTTVQGFPGVPADVVSLTVARQEVFISLGTGNTIQEINADTQYQVDFAVQVTDANGNGVANVPLALSILSVSYVKGLRVVVVGAGWSTQTNATCADEDTLLGPASTGYRNGSLDVGEDFNTSGSIEAGNIASVGPSNITTDANGSALVSVVYPQEYAYYVTVELAARASVQGTEFVRTSTFLLPGSADDFDDEDVSPPGPVSPFGVAASCANPD